MLLVLVIHWLREQPRVPNRINTSESWRFLIIICKSLVCHLTILNGLSPWVQCYISDCGESIKLILVLTCCRRHRWYKTTEQKDKRMNRKIKTNGLWGGVLLWRVLCLLHQGALIMSPLPSILFQTTWEKHGKWMDTTSIWFQN